MNRPVVLRAAACMAIGLAACGGGSGDSGPDSSVERRTAQALPACGERGSGILSDLDVQVDLPSSLIAGELGEGTATLSVAQTSTSTVLVTAPQTGLIGYPVSEDAVHAISETVASAVIHEIEPGGVLKLPVVLSTRSCDDSSSPIPEGEYEYVVQVLTADVVVETRPVLIRVEDL